MVLDADGTVLHTELVPEIAQEPDYDAALAALWPIRPTPATGPGSRAAWRPAHGRYGAAMPAPLLAAPIDLGPFRLDEPIATGGMGSIWRGRHRGQGTPVAIKVMVADELQSETFRRAFRNEAWAMASLDHRGIVMVFDQGTVTAEAAAASDGRLQAGSPFIVMDLVDGGILSDVPPRTWWELKSTLLLLLDALAHAHARGVVHRDLKPANILVDPDVAGSGGLQLTDFGIAHAAGRVLGSDEASAMPVMGTLHYMAPEQMDGRWRDYGPWTDLYSLGCIAWELATGHRPFEAEDPIDLMDMHLDEEPPAFEPRIPVPDGFHDWVLRLLVKEPFARPRRAADAAHDLKLLGEPGDDERTRALGLTMLEGLPAVKPQEIDAWMTLPEQQRATARPSDISLLELGLETLSAIAPVRPAPSHSGTWDPDSTVFDEDSSARRGIRLQLSWRRQRRPRPWRSLSGAGLGLWGLRTIPLVGRDAELDAIWETLREVHREGRARAVVLEGGLGTGSSRVARWLCERAHELGVADIYWATHSPTPRPSDGIGRMLGREFRCSNLSRGMRCDRIADVLVRRGLTSSSSAEDLADGLARWLDPGRPRLDGTTPGTLLNDETRPRFRWIYKLLTRTARRRPILVWLDDAQWGIEALAFADYVLRAQKKKPAELLLLVGVQQDALEAGGRADRLLEGLLGDRRTQHISLKPLAEPAQEMLVRDLLGLEGDLSRRVASSSGGNPLFATQLVGEWVRRRVLEAGPDGFRLRSGAEASIPVDLPSLWLERVRASIGDLGQPAIEVLELAAALGGRVQHREFKVLLRTLEMELPDGLLDRLFAERLAVPSKGGWSFVHDALRDALERRARAGRRWMAYRQAVRELQGRANRSDTTKPTAVVG